MIGYRELRWEELERTQSRSTGTSPFLCGFANLSDTKMLKYGGIVGMGGG